MSHKAINNCSSRLSQGSKSFIFLIFHTIFLEVSETLLKKYLVPLSKCVPLHTVQLFDSKLPYIWQTLKTYGLKNGWQRYMYKKLRFAEGSWNCSFKQKVYKWWIPIFAIRKWNLLCGKMSFFFGDVRLWKFKEVFNVFLFILFTGAELASLGRPRFGLGMFE